MPAGQCVTWADVEFDATDDTVMARREMETYVREAVRTAAE